RDGLIAAVALAEDRAKAFSFHRFMDNLGAGVGLFLAFLLVCLLVPYFSSRGLADRAVAEKVYRSIFLVASIPAVIAVMLVIFFVREKKPTGAQSVKLNFRAGFKPRFWFFLVTVLIFSLGNSSNAFLVLRSQEIFAKANGPVQSIIQWEIPLVLLALMLSSAAFNLPGGWLADKIGRAPVLIAGWVVYALVYLGFGFASEPWHLWCLFIAYGLFHGLSEGAERAIVADLAREEVRGSAYGLFNFAEGVAKFPASLIMGIIYVWKGPAAAFGIDAALAALAAVMLAGFLIARKRRVKA
ncbi:MAG: MFS transporter, partial [Planctomycetia bacterium]|nr:MFS transporter [Planctomycetia bacterium]